MISMETFFLLLFVVSLLTSLTTEGIKNILANMGKSYYSNVLTGVLATVLAMILGSMNVILSGLSFNTPNIIILVALVFLSWLCSMVGYDKVMQMIDQIKHYGKKGDDE